MSTIRRELLDESVRSSVQEFTEKIVFLGKAPVTKPKLPYAVQYPITTSGGYGAWIDPEECRDFVYQFTCVGTDPRQCGWMSDRIVAAMTGRKANGDYQLAISPSGLSIYWRQVVSLGAMLPTGEELWQVADTYRMRVGP